MKQSALFVCAALAFAASPSALATWSIIAMNAETGDVGVAAASCVPGGHADALASLVPGFGVSVTQAVWTLNNRNRMHDGLLDGLSAREMIDEVADPALDDGLARRQYSAVTIVDGEIEIAGFTGGSTPEWSGTQVDRGMAVSVQGNTLVSEAVVSEALAAFIAESPNGSNALPDRLMRSLEAGSVAGGDVRCNRDGITSTAATAFILVARGGDAPYATSNIRMTDQGTAAAPWLAISEFSELEGPNPITVVRQRFDRWKAARSRQRGSVFIFGLLGSGVIATLIFVWNSRRQ